MNHNHPSGQRKNQERGELNKKCYGLNGRGARGNFAPPGFKNIQFQGTTVTLQDRC